MNFFDIRYFLIALFATCSAVLYLLWQSEVSHFREYEQQIYAMGAEAEAKAKETEAKQELIRKEIEDAWNAKLPKVRQDAIDNFNRSYAKYGLCKQDSSSSNLPGIAASPESIDGTSKESVVACPSEFVSNSAEDALKVQMWQEWAKGNNVRTE